MEPTIINKDNEPRGKGNSRLHVTFNNSDVSITNSLRRVITSNINTLVFRGFPHSENQINILKNTTKFNNEYLKHRISCIPIMNNDESTFSSFCNLYQVELNVTNNSLEKIYVTTKDLKIIDKKTKKEIKENTNKYFPPDPITGDYILICILYANQNKNEENESIHFIANFDEGNAQQCSTWNVVNHCIHENIKDESKIKQHLLNIEDKFKKRDFELLDAQRMVIKNQYKLSLESIGIFTNEELMYKACKYILNRLSQISSYLTKQSNHIQSKLEYDDIANDGTLSQELRNEFSLAYCALYKEDDFYILEIKDDDYTIGKLIENYFYQKYRDYISFIGFKKEHPTKKEAYIYIKYNNNEELIIPQLSELLQFLNKIFTSIQNEFIIN